MIVYYNDNQENLLNELKEINRSSSGIFKKDLIKELRDILIKKEEFLVKVQVSRDGLLGSLRRIEWAYKEHEKIPFDYQGHDEREALMLVFFHNAKCFIEIFKKCFPKIKLDGKHRKIFNEITIIRNFFAHSYEKDFLENKTFIRININNQFNEGLSELEIFDFDTAEKTHGVFFSLANFFSEINRLIEKLIKHLQEKQIS